MTAVHPRHETRGVLTWRSGRKAPELKMVIPQSLIRSWACQDGRADQDRTKPETASTSFLRQPYQRPVRNRYVTSHSFCVDARYPKVPHGRSVEMYDARPTTNQG